LKEADTFMLERFTCANALQVATRTNNGVPAWLVRYFGDFTNTRLYLESGAYHGVDLHMIFGASSDITGLPLSVAEVGLSGLMQRALVAFANDPEHGLEAEMAWPRFDEGGKTMILLGVENEVAPRMVFPRSYNAVCNYTIYD
jgi:cholinesterase